MFNFSGFLETLPIMGKGMLGIFIVILVLYFTITVLTKIFKK